MHIRRQLLAAGLLLLAVRVAPVEAWRLALPAQAASPSPNSAFSASAGEQKAYLPIVMRTVPAVYDVAISGVEVVQGVTMSDLHTVHIAGRPALLRVFVVLTGGASLDGVTARLTRYVEGAPQGELAAGPLQLVAGGAGDDQGDLTHTFNFNLPASWLTYDSAYVVELDPSNAVAETNEANNRYPAAGEQPFDFISMAGLDVVIVPVSYMRPGGTPTTPPLDDLSYLTWMPEKVLPLSQINYTVRSTAYVFTGDLRTAAGWGELLVAIDAIRAAEDPSWNKLYYGLVDAAGADGCPYGCYTGLGYVNSPGRTVYKTSIGFAGFPGNRGAASTTFTHEMGHNFGRRHAPCAGPSNVDAAYPYAGGVIGQWGYDAATGLLMPPGYRDYMSYCGPEWTSDYTYYGIAQAWGWLNAPATSGVAAAANGAGESLVVSGYVSPDGRLHVDPIFRASAPPQRLSAAPTHRLELVDASGRVLATVPFDLAEAALDVTGGDEHVPGARAGGAGESIASFRVEVEPVTGLAGFRIYDGQELIFERFAAGVAPEFEVAADAQAVTAADGASSLSWQLAAGAGGIFYRVRFSPDGGTTWHLLALDTTTPRVAVPASLLADAAAPVLEVQASDGVRSAVQQIPLDAP